MPKLKVFRESDSENENAEDIESFDENMPVLSDGK